MDLWTAFVTIGLAWVIVMMAIMIGWAIYGLVEAVRNGWALREIVKTVLGRDQVKGNAGRFKVADSQGPDLSSAFRFWELGSGVMSPMQGNGETWTSKKASRMTRA
jgi:hypothetical protein